METYISPYSQDFNYNKMMSSLRNLNLSPCNQERFSRNNVHAGIYASHYSCYSPKPEFFDQANNVRGPELLDRAPQRNLQSNGESHHYAPVPSVPMSFVDTNTFSDQERMRVNVGPGHPWMYYVANQVPGISMPGGTVPAYHPTYCGGSAMSQNGCSGPGFTRPRSNDQNVNNQEFTETRGNGQNGYGDREFTERTNLQGAVSMTMAMRNEELMFLQNAIVVELVQCMSILNEILGRSLPQLEAKMAVPTIPTRIFVGGLASTVTESDFKTYFGQFGTITNAEVKYDHITQRTRGFGFITFDSEKAVERVLLRTSFHELNGKMVEVKRAFPKDLYRKTIRGQLGGINYGLRKMRDLFSAYSQACSPSQVGVSGNAY